MAHGLDDQIIDVQLPARVVILFFPSEFCSPASLDNGCRGSFQGYNRPASFQSVNTSYLREYTWCDVVKEGYSHQYNFIRIMLMVFMHIHNVTLLFNLLKPNDIYIYIYMSNRSANLQTLHFIYLFNKYTY